MEKIAILDFGGQYTHLEARCIRQLGVYSEILSPQCKVEDLKDYIGIIFSGGPASVYDPKAPLFNDEILKIDLPILGLCYGHQLLNLKLGGAVSKGLVHEFGAAEFEPDLSHPLFAGLSARTTMWMSHGDEVSKLPPGFREIGKTEHCAFAAVANDSQKRYAVQFHPEVTHSVEGNLVLKNFLTLCGAKFTWKMDSYAQQLEENLRQQCIGKKVFLLVSGGVDSTVAFALLNRALGEQNVLGLHIDNGLMRKDESADVIDFMQREGFRNLKIKDASETFLQALKGITAPEAKRKIIGETFIQVKDAELLALKLNPQDWLLAQGTIYPDTIESGGTQNAAVIKTHHNRVDSIKELIALGLVVEPLAELYKDEVRELGLLLGIPEKLIWRHPFPGPGLGVRLLCNADLNKEIDPTLREGLQKFGQENDFKGEVLAVESVGVQGDARTYAHPLVLQNLRDWKRAETLSTLITNRFRGVNRVVLEIGRISDAPYTLIAAYCEKSALDFLREADALCHSLLYANNLYRSIWQMPVVLLPLTISQKPVIVLRPVHSSEAMTARFATIDFALLDTLWQQLKTLGAGALLYDVTHKPPGTIEWE